MKLNQCSDLKDNIFFFHAQIYTMKLNQSSDLNVIKVNNVLSLSTAMFRSELFNFVERMTTKSKVYRYYISIILLIITPI